MTLIETSLMFIPTYIAAVLILLNAFGFESRIRIRNAVDLPNGKKGFAQGRLLPVLSPGREPTAA